MDPVIVVMFDKGPPEGSESISGSIINGGDSLGFLRIPYECFQK